MIEAHFGGLKAQLIGNAQFGTERPQLVIARENGVIKTVDRRAVTQGQRTGQPPKHR